MTVNTHRNLTNDTITDAEMQLLNKGLKYNSQYKPKEWIKTLAIKADTAISRVYERDQTYMRQLVTNNIQKLISKQKPLKKDDNLMITRIPRTRPYKGH
jgi:hypothetical protein